MIKIPGTLNSNCRIKLELCLKPTISKNTTNIVKIVRIILDVGKIARECYVYGNILYCLNNNLNK